MALFVHCAPERLARRIRRSGLTGPPLFCFPVLPSYTLTHQWARELRRDGRSRSTVAVTFALPDAESVEVGHFGRPRVTLPAAEAVALVRALADPLGYEVVVPRAVAPGELRRIRAVSRRVGWRYTPDEHGRRPCSCPACLRRGAYGAAGIRARYGDDRVRVPYREVLARLRSPRPDVVTEAVWDLAARGRGRGEPADVAFLAEHPSAEVREAFAAQLPSWRGPLARDLLAALADDPDPQVRAAAAGYPDDEDD